jgi:pSer/pThr/pTyr-binding forkhead associated (FHA) protein
MTILARAFPTTADYPADPRITRSIKLDGPKLRIGRASDCDLRLPDLGVSRHHATLARQGKRYVLTDEGSACGTWLGGPSFDRPMRRLVPHRPHPIVGETVLRFGPLHLLLDPDVEGPGDGPGERRMFTFDLLARAVHQLGHYPLPTLRVLEGPDRDEWFDLRALWGLPLTAGRCPDADFRLVDKHMSRRHFEVAYRGGAWVRDVGSKHGTRLDGMPLTPGTFVPWRQGATLCAGGSVIAYQNPVAEALEELDRGDEELSDGRILRPLRPAAGARSVSDVNAPPAPSSRDVDDLLDAPGGDECPPSTVRRRGDGTSPSGSSSPLG